MHKPSKPCKVCKTCNLVRYKTRKPQGTRLENLARYISSVYLSRRVSTKTLILCKVYRNDVQIL